MQIAERQLKFVIIDDDEIDRAVVETEAAKFSFLEKMTLAIPVITATNSSALVCRIPNMNRWKISWIGKNWNLNEISLWISGLCFAKNNLDERPLFLEKK